MAFQCDSQIALRINSTALCNAISALYACGQSAMVERILSEMTDHCVRLKRDCQCYRHRTEREARTAGEGKP